MAEESSATVSRLDPYKNYRFKLHRAGKCVLGAASCKGLASKPEGRVVSDANTKITPQANDHTITLERAITCDLEFQMWAKSSLASSPKNKAILGQKTPEFFLEIVDEHGGAIQRYRLYGCRVAEWASLPELNTEREIAAIEQVTLAIEHWTIDL